jgi:Domain of unknown function (DUF4037)
VTTAIAPGMISGVPARFVPGVDLAAAYFAELLRPLLAAEFPRLRYAAALLGPGSDVLGYDTARSVDHDWGPRLQIFLDTGDAARHAGTMTSMLGSRLPESFRGYRTAFPSSKEPGAGPRHRVQVADLGAWLAGELGFDPRATITVTDWLAAPAQRLAEITGGAVFHDEPGQLTAARDKLAWYPRDVWLYVLACQWQRICQEEAFPGRCAEAGDDLGSAVVTARLARDLMRLCLLMHRRYPPYSKWLGTAFARLPEAGELVPALSAAIAATSWTVREQQLSRALESAAVMHNELGITAPLDARTRPFHDRPYQVIDAARFAAALRQAITDPQLAQRPPTGAADQYIDSTDALGDIGFVRAATAAAGTSQRQDG